MANELVVISYTDDNDGTFFQLRDSDLTYISEWNFSASQYSLGNFAVDTRGNIFFTKGNDKYVRQYTIDGEAVDTLIPSSSLVVFGVAINKHGYICTQQIDTSGSSYSIKGNTREADMRFVYAALLSLKPDRTYYKDGVICADSGNSDIYYVTAFHEILRYNKSYGSYYNRLEASKAISDMDGLSQIIQEGEKIYYGRDLGLPVGEYANGEIMEIGKSLSGDPSLAFYIEPDGVTDGEVLYSGGYYFGKFNDEHIIILFAGLGYTWNAGVEKWESVDSYAHRYLRKYNISTGEQVGVTVDLGIISPSTKGNYRIGDYYDFALPLSPDITSKEAIIVDQEEGKVRFKIGILGKVGNCCEQGYEYRLKNSPSSTKRTYDTEFWEDGDYTIPEAPYTVTLDNSKIYEFRGIGVNSYAEIYGEWVEFSFETITLINIKADRQGDKIRLYGEIL